MNERRIKPDGSVWELRIVEENGELVEVETLIKAPPRSAQDDTDSILVDHEYRLTLLELGLIE